MRRLSKFSGGRLRPSEGGWTLIELMLVTALIGIIVPAITFLFIKCSEGMAADEMHMQLKTLNAQTMLRLHERVDLSRHMFQNNQQSVTNLGSGGTTFLTRLVMSSAPPTITLSGSVTCPLAQALPTTETSFSPNSGAPSAYFGNALFMACYDNPQTLGTTPYTAPLTIFTQGTNSVTYGTTNGGGPATVVLDVYRFYYYYLTPITTNRISSVYKLVEWESVQFVDEFEIANISDSTLKGNVVSYLKNATYTGSPVTFGYDPTQSDPGQAFYQLTGGTVFTLEPNQTIPMAQFTYLTRVQSGILSNGFTYGIAGNGVNPNGAAAVPEFAATAGSFPGAFEVGISGSQSGMEVMLRSMLVGAGATAPNLVWDDVTTVNNANDVW